MRLKKIIIALSIFIFLFLVAFWQFFYKQKNPISETITFNQTINSKTNKTNIDYYESNYKDKEIVWIGKISNYYTQITGIKFCIIDKEHQNVNTDNSCDWFWASSEKTKDADIYSINPDWDGNWVNYILNYYEAIPDSKDKIYTSTYEITGTINGIDCGIDDKCHPDIEIINIKIN